MSGISSKAAGKIENKKGYNGNELQNKEFSDGSGLEFYDFNARTYDQQLGRFIQIDPMTEEGGQESLSPFQFGLNNPIKYNDPDGKIWNLIVGAIVGAAVEYGTQVAVNLVSGKSLGESLTNVSGGSILIAAGAGALTSGASALVPKGVVATVAKEVASIAIDGVESASKQYVETGNVSVSKVATDVIANKIGGKIMDNVGAGAVKTAEKQLNHAERVLAGDVASTGRQQAVSNAQTNVSIANLPKQAASGAASNAVQATTDATIAAAKNPAKAPNLGPVPVTVDNTSNKLLNNTGFH